MTHRPIVYSACDKQRDGHVAITSTLHVSALWSQLDVWRQVSEYLTSAESDGEITGDAFQLNAWVKVVLWLRVQMYLRVDDNSKRLHDCKTYYDKSAFSYYVRWQRGTARTRAAIDRPATVKFFAAVAHAKTDRQRDKQTDRRTDRLADGRPTDAETRHGTGSLGHRVNGSFGSSFTSGSLGHRVIILTRCETRVFPVFEKMPKMQNVHL